MWMTDSTWSGSDGIRVAVACLMLLTAAVFEPACANDRVVNQMLADATLDTQVKTAILNASDVDASRIDVDTSRGVVTLRGVARSPEQAARIVSITKAVPGVTRVRSKIKVPRPSSVPS